MVVESTAAFNLLAKRTEDAPVLAHLSTLRLSRSFQRRQNLSQDDKI